MRKPRVVLKRRAMLKRWALALVLFVAPAAIYVGWVALQRWRTEAYARDAVSALTYCMMGAVSSEAVSSEAVSSEAVSSEAVSSEAVSSGRAVPLGSEGSSLGADARQLRAVAIGAELAEDDGWPGRCEPFVSSARRALDGLHARAAAPCEGQCCAADGRCARILDLKREVARLRTYLVLGDKSGFDADAFVGLGRSLGLVSGAAEGAPAPPREAEVLDHTSMRPLFEGDYLRLLTDPAGSDSLSLLFYEEERSYRMCSIDLGNDAAADCGSLPNSIPVGQAGELLAAEVGAPQRIYAQGKEDAGWVEALYDVKSGHEVARVDDRPSGGFVWKDGSVAHLASGPPHALHRLRAGVKEAPVPLAMAAQVSSGPRLIWDEIVWAERMDDGRHRVLARRALAGDEPLGPLAYLGVTPPLAGAPSIEVCRTDEVLALLVGANDEKGGVDATLLFRDEGGWQAPTEVHIDTTRFGFTCRKDTATLSWIVGVEELPDLSFLGEVDTEASLPVGGRYSVHRLRCGGGDCQHDHADVPLKRHSRSSRYVAGDAGDSMVVLWRSVLGDVRMKIAPLHALADAPARAVFDDVEHDGFDWDLERDPIIGRAGSVVVLLSRQIGTSVESATYAFAVREDGAITPVEVSGRAL